MPSNWKEKVEKSFKTCPHCREKLPLRAKFCFYCGQKFEAIKPIPPISGIKEINGQININWLKHQYYDLGRTMQDIANELGVSMIRIRKLLSRIEIISETKEVESMTDVPPLKTEEVQRFSPISDLLQGERTSKPIPSVSELKTEDKKIVSSSWQEKVEKSFKTCPHCRQKLPLGAKFCVTCGQKVEVLKPIPQISAIKEANGQADLDLLIHQYYDLGRSMQDIADELGVSMIRIRKLFYRFGAISGKKEVESITDVPPLTTEEVKPSHLVSEIEVKEPSKPITSVSELKSEDIQTEPSASEEKVEKTFITCPHCRQKLPLETKFCTNCGQKVEVLKPIPPVSVIEEETVKISPAEEVLPTTPVIEIKKEKLKKKPRICKFCGMRIPKNSSFCLQCGMIIKIRLN